MYKVGTVGNVLRYTYRKFERDAIYSVANAIYSVANGMYSVANSIYTVHSVKSFVVPTVTHLVPLL